MASEGSREIEAARQRLTAAKTQASSAAKMMESAKAMLEMAQKEVNAAETCLNDAEKRWEVINIDSDDESQEIQSRIKRRKVSLSPQGSNAAARGKNVAGAPVRRSSDVVSVGAAAVVRQPKKNGTSDAGRTKASGSTRKVRTLLESEIVGNVDGTYQRVDEKNDGVPMYRKEGLWNKHALDFVMYRGMYHKCGPAYWFIGVSGYKTLFVNLSKGNTERPPRDGWTTMDEPKSTPLLKDAIISRHLGLHFGTAVTSPAMGPMMEKRRAIEEKTRGVARVSVEGCGIPEMNGEYKKALKDNGDYISDDVPVFRKKGQWEGNKVNFLLFRKESKGRKKWKIGAPEAGHLFQVNGDFHTVGPPGRGWRAIGKGIYPGPKFRVLA